MRRAAPRRRDARRRRTARAVRSAGAPREARCCAGRRPRPRFRSGPASPYGSRPGGRSGRTWRRRPPARPRRPAAERSRGGARGSTRRPRGARRLSAGESAFSTNRRSATSGSRPGASVIRSTVARGIGCASGPPGVVHARTSRSTREAWASASSCATMPPRLVPTTCARSTPASSSTCTASARQLGDGVGPRSGASLSPMPRLSKRTTSNRSARPGSTGSQPHRA